MASSLDTPFCDQHVQELPQDRGTVHESALPRHRGQLASAPCL